MVSLNLSSHLDHVAMLIVQTATLLRGRLSFLVILALFRRYCVSAPATATDDDVRRQNIEMTSYILIRLITLIMLQCC